MAPGVLANELPQLFVVLEIDTGYLFAMKYAGALQLIRHPSNAANALGHRGEIVTALIGAFLEIVKIDPRRLTRIA